MAITTTDTTHPLNQNPGAGPPTGGGGATPPPITGIVPNPAPAPSTISNGLTADQSSAQGILNSFFAAVGLPSLSAWAWGKWLQGDSVNQIMLEARGTQEYKNRYPAMDTLDKSGRGISEAAYQSYEQNISALAQQYGLPKGMYDSPESVANLLTRGVSINEAQQRAQLAASAAYTAPQSTRDAMGKLFGLTNGGLVAMYLDSDRALPLLQTQFQAAQIAGAGYEQGVDVGLPTALKLAQQGVSYQQAQQGLGSVASTSGLGYGQGEQADQETRIAAAFGDATAQTTVQRVVKGRLAAFGPAGGAAQGNTGVAGLGIGSA